MSPTRHTSRRARSLAAVALGLTGWWGLAGCGADDAPATADPSVTSSASPTTTSSPSARASSTSSPGPSSSPPSSSPSASSGPTERASTDLLLTAREMPAPDDLGQWSVRRTTVDPVTLGTCSRVAMQTLGADEVVTRVFVPTGDDGVGVARHAVARFVDDRSADQAESVLRTFHDTCRQRLTGFTSVQVSPVRDVAVTGVDASWFTTRTTKAGARAHANTLGMLRSGTTIELVELDGGRDPGGTSARPPIVSALVRAAARLA